MKSFVIMNTRAFSTIIMLSIASLTALPHAEKSYRSPVQSYGQTNRAQAVTPSRGPSIAIVRSAFNSPGRLIGNSDFDYVFESQNGIKQQAIGETKFVGDKDVVTMKGSYEYVGDDGQLYIVEWYADETGFHASGAHLPREVSIPFPDQAEAVAAQISFAAQEGNNAQVQSGGRYVQEKSEPSRGSASTGQAYGSPNYQSNLPSYRAR